MMMGSGSSSEEEEEEIEVIETVIETRAAMPEPLGDGEWDIRAALERRGQYPNWDLDWLQKLLADKIKHLSNLVHEMQERNFVVERGILERLAQLRSFSETLKKYASKS